MFPRTIITCVVFCFINSTVKFYSENPYINYKLWEIFYKHEYHFKIRKLHISVICV